MDARGTKRCRPLLEESKGGAYSQRTLVRVADDAPTVTTQEQAALPRSKHERADPAGEAADGEDAALVPGPTPPVEKRESMKLRPGGVMYSVQLQLTSVAGSAPMAKSEKCSELQPAPSCP